MDSERDQRRIKTIRENQKYVSEKKRWEKVVEIGSMPKEGKSEI